MTSLRRILAIVVLASCTFIAAYVAFRSGHPRLRPVEQATSTLAGASGAGHGATAMPSAGDAAQQSGGEGPRANPIPDTLPDAHVPDLNGKPKSLRDFLGHPLIVNFWATWCAPCRREMPLLQQLQQRYRAQGLQVLGVAVDSRAAVQQYLTRRPVDYPILAGETEGTEAMNRFGAQPVLPFSVFADAQGHIVVVKLGELHPEEADSILGTERDLTAGRLTLEEARTAIETQLRDLAVARAKAASAAGHDAP